MGADGGAGAGIARFGLTLPTLLDVVHAIHVERVTQQVLAVISAGGQVSLQDALDDFDKALNDDPAVRSERDELLEALGVR